MKRCCTCRVEKSTGDFWNHGRTTDGLHPSCKECARRYHRAKWAAMSWEAKFARRARQRYRLSQQQVVDLLARGMTCWACSASLDQGVGGHAIDHNHTTGAVRGLLCPRCNVALGFLEDRALVANLRQYLAADVSIPTPTSTVET